MKITAPNYTQTPNDLFDHWLPLLGEAELKVLLVIMRKTFGWHKTHDAISVSQLASITGMCEETVIKAARSLQKKGVISRKVIGKNGTQQTIYSLIVEEESNNTYPSDNRRGKGGPLGLNPPVKTEAQKKPSSTKEKQQQAASAAAAVPSKKAKEEKPNIHPCLESVDIPSKEKIWLTKKYDEETVKNAIAWATSPQTKINTTLTQAIKWACAERPEMPLDSKASVKENKDFAKQYDEVQNEYAKIHALNKHVEITPLRGQSQPIIIEYNERDFAMKFKEARVKYRLG